MTTEAPANPIRVVMNIHGLKWQAAFPTSEANPDSMECRATITMLIIGFVALQPLLSASIAEPACGCRRLLLVPDTSKLRPNVSVSALPVCCTMLE